MNNVSLISDVLGVGGIMVVTGLLVFIFCLRYSRDIFDWIEQQTLGTRTYLLEKFELLFIEVDSDRLTMGLLLYSLFLSLSFLILFGLWIGWFVGFIVAVVIGFFSCRLPREVVDFMVERRIKQYSVQMVDGLTLLSNGIRAGLSVPQSLGMVVNEMPSPISQEFGLILQQNRIGVPLEECFDNLAVRVPTADNDMFVASMNILRETGGNLAEVFDTIVNVIRERVRLQQKVDTYTAQGMVQAIIIASMPFAIMGIYAASDPNSIKLMLTQPIGIILTIIALLLDFIGFYIILKIVKIKI
jgi:tight adherence protein B